VPFDRSGRQGQLATDLGVGQPVSRETGNRCFLRGERGRDFRRRLVERFADGGEFTTSTLSERVGPMSFSIRYALLSCVRESVRRFCRCSHSP